MRPALLRPSGLLLLSATALAAADLNFTSVNLTEITYPFGVALSSIDGLAAQVDDIVTALLADIGSLLPTSELQFYGQSPPVYPAPTANGNGDWADAYAKASALVSQMTLTEKANITLGQLSTNGCSGFTGSVERLGFPGICLNDAESGVRGGELVSGFPAQLSVGASWNRTLAGERAVAIGKEFRGKGVNVALGPVAGPIGRLAKGGRNWEGFSNDPYLSGSLIGPTVEGIQQSVVSCVKHFVAYEQETNRQPFFLGFIPGLGQQSVSSNVDDRTLHELYMWPFYDALQAGVGSVMASYNRVNNSFASQNSKLMNGLLKTELGFQGFVVSDWFGTHTGIAANNAGLDLIMPFSTFLSSPSALETAVNNGSLNQSRLNDQATRILTSWYRFAELANPGMTDYASTDVTTAEGNAVNFQSAVEGHVLVKNINSTLPLSKPSTLSLFGYDAVGGSNTSSQGPVLYEIGLANTQQYPDGQPFTLIDAGLFSVSIEPDNSGPSIALDGTLITGGGSGAVTPNYTYAPYDAFLQQAALDGTTLNTDFTSQAPTVKSPSDPCIVFINTQSAETWDRSELSDDYSDTLVTNVAAQCSNTIVVIHNAGIRLVEDWIDNPNVTAVIYAHPSGQESGLALVELMYGRQSFSGRLPYTVAKQESDYGALLSPTESTDKYPQSNFSEGLNIDYKYFIAQGIEPRFAFGFGLTYSNFSYSSLQVTYNSSADTGTLPPDYDTTPVPQGGLASLYDIVATVSATVTNTGTTAAGEVAQLYIGIPGSGVPKALRGFDKQLLAAGQSMEYTFPLRRRDLSVWDVVQQQWILNSGSYTLMVGKDVLDIQLQGTLTIG